VSRDLVQLWTAPQCQTGAVPLGPLTTWATARVSLADGAPPALSLSGVLRAELAAADAREGCAVRVLSPTRGVSWWIVAQITDAATSDTATMRCTPLRTLLGMRGLVRIGAVYSFTPPADVSLRWLVRDYVLSTAELAGARPELAEDGLDWIELRTVDEPATPIVLPPFAGQTRGQVLSTIEQLSQRTAVLVAKDPLGATGFWLDVLRDPDAALVETRLVEGIDVVRAERTRDVQRAASVVVPFGANTRPLGMTEWTVTAIDGAGPAWVTLRDPSAAENRWPIREDGQLVGAFVRLALGDTREITESRASDSSVRIASITGLSVNDRVGLVLDADSTPVDEVVSPSRLARVGRVVATQSASAPTLARQWARNGRVQEWTDPTTPTHWTLVGGCGVVRYRRVEEVTAWAAVTDAAYVIGNTVIGFTGAIANSRLYGSEVLDFAAGTDRVIGSGLVEADGSGNGTVTLAAGLTANVASGSVIAAKIRISTNGGEPGRPFYTLMTRDGDPEHAMRFRTQASSTTYPTPVDDAQVRSAPVRVHLQTDRPELNTVRAAVGLTMTNGAGNTEIGNLDGSSAITTDPASIAASGRRLPAVLLVGDPTGTPTRLAHGIFAPSIPAGAVVNTVVTCQHTITADTTVAVGITPPRNAPLYLPFSVVRWAALWLGDETDPPVVDGSPSNPAWHAAQDALAAAQARWRLTGVDLAALLGDGAPLALGQRVRLSVPSMAEDGRWRIVRLDWSLDDTETVDLELGAVQPRLTAVTVSV
jgi:hypothetical protein